MPEITHTHTTPMQEPRCLRLHTHTTRFNIVHLTVQGLQVKHTFLTSNSNIWLQQLDANTHTVTATICFQEFTSLIHDSYDSEHPQLKTGELKEKSSSHVGSTS